MISMGQGLAADRLAPAPRGGRVYNEMLYINLGLLFNVCLLLAFWDFIYHNIVILGIIMNILSLLCVL